MTPRPTEIHRIGFISTRISGTDGVSLEIDKWATVLERMGYSCYYICGLSDRPIDRTYLIELADFKHPAIAAINAQAFGRQHRSRGLSAKILEAAWAIKLDLHKAVEKFDLDLVIVENAFTIPINIPLGLALVDLVLETGIPCIAHHHDFHWERLRYLFNCVKDYLRAAFPPALSQIDHVVINSVAGQEFSRRTGLPFRVIPNVMDFAHPPDPPDDYSCGFRNDIGVADTDILILQPTRIVLRKGIEHSIELIRRLDDPRCKLVVTFDGADEGDAYPRYIREFSELMNVEIIYASSVVSSHREIADDGRKLYSIWDVYPHCDLVTYPSTYEGFGNAFLESVYYHKLLLCNRYAIYQTDIEPYGFKSVLMNGFLTNEVVDNVRELLTDADKRHAIEDMNYELAREAFSYDRIEKELGAAIDNIKARAAIRKRI